MKILYFSRNYTPHDYRFLASLSKTDHEIYYLKLEANQRQVEDRPVPENVQQILWAGGRREFRWSDLPRLALDFRRVVKKLKPDIVHAGPIQTCTFIAVLSGFRPILTKSWGYDLIHDADKNAWMKWVTSYVLRNSAFFIGDSNVIRDKAVMFGMNPENIVLFPWGVNIERFAPNTSKRTALSVSKGSNVQTLTLFCSRTWEAIYGVDVLAKAFVKVASVNPDVNLILLGWAVFADHLCEAVQIDAPRRQRLDERVAALVAELGGLPDAG
jgi:glycosyltransferase involved in cell wall biosynthesis